MTISRTIATLPSKCYNSLGASPSPLSPGGEVLKGRVRADALQIARAHYSPIARDIVMMIGACFTHAYTSTKSLSL